MTRKTIALMLAVLLAVSLGACTNGSSEPTPSADTKISVTDQTGNTVTLDAPATKVVAITPATCEIIYALGAGEVLIGRGTYCDYPNAVFDIPDIGSGENTNIEQILALEPELVVMATMAQDPAQAQQLRDAGIQVYSTEAASIEETYESIVQIGELLGKKSEADELVSSMKSAFKMIEDAPLSGTVYFEVSPLEWGLWSAGKGTFMDEIASMMGLTNIFADIDGWAQVSEEQVLERNPDFILTIGMAYGDYDPVAEILGRTAWQEVTAVKNAAVLNIADNSLARPAPRLVDGANALYQFVKDNQ